MAIALIRTARTTYVKEVADFGTAIAGTDGKFFAYPAALGVSPFVDLDLKPTLAQVPELAEGDVIITNHPFTTGGLASHLPDLQLVRPYFHDGAIVAYGWVFAHTSDIGGGAPSSISPRFSELFQEGLIIPPTKLIRAGIMNEEFLKLYAANCRTPDDNIGDLRAMLAALSVGAERTAQLIAQHGVTGLLAAQRDLAAYAAEKARAVLRGIPDGTYEFWDYLDDDYVSRIPVRIRCAMTVRDGLVHLDYAGTDPQVEAAYNLPTGGTRHPWVTVKLMHLICSVDKTAPLNHGLYTSITVAAPAGTLVNPEFPAACGVRHAAVIRTMDTLVGALTEARPGLLPAPNGGAAIPAVLASYDETSGLRRSVVMQSLVSGSGGRPGADGVDGRESGMANTQNAPVERTEEVSDVVVEEYGLRADSGGPGQWRGGTGLVFTVRVLKEGCAVLGRGLERFVFRPWGVAGGAAAACSQVILNRGTATERELGKIDVLELHEGDTVTFMTPGGGGYGDPFQRDPAAVLSDVQRGFVSVAAAERDYGVALRDGAADFPANWAIDAAATAALRARARPPRPAIDFGPERMRWESVFDDASMLALNRALMALPAPARARRRRAVFYEVAPALAQPGAVDMARIIDDPPVQRARLAAAIARLAGRRAA
jgi:N-methylhydantoinase B